MASTASGWRMAKRGSSMSVRTEHMRPNNGFGGHGDARPSSSSDPVEKEEEEEGEATAATAKSKPDPPGRLPLRRRVQPHAASPNDAARAGNQMVTLQRETAASSVLVFPSKISAKTSRRDFATNVERELKATMSSTCQKLFCPILGMGVLIVVVLQQLGHKFPKTLVSYSAAVATPPRVHDSDALCNARWPDLELFVTMADSFHQEFKDELLQSMLFFWPLEHLKMAIVLDEETKSAEFERKLLADTKDFQTAHIEYHAPSPYYGVEGHDRQQLIMFWADNFTNSEYVGFVDTDTFFVTPVDRDDLFEDGKPVVIGGMYDYQYEGWWEWVPLSTQAVLGEIEVFRCMNYFPVIIKTSHLKALRDFVYRKHGKHFDEFFQGMYKDGWYSQFNIMCNYVWYHHRDEYTWYVEQSKSQLGVNKTVPAQPRANKTAGEVGVHEDMFYPKPRVAIHSHHHTKKPSAATFNQTMLTGYCYDQHMHGRSMEQTVCGSIKLAPFNADQFQFEGHDWTFHKKTREAFERRQQRRQRCPHQWNQQQVERLASAVSNRM